MHCKHAQNTDSYAQLPTDSGLVRAYEHIVIQNKNNRNMTHLNVAKKSTAGSLILIIFHFLYLLGILGLTMIKLSVFALSWQWGVHKS